MPIKILHGVWHQRWAGRGGGGGSPLCWPTVHIRQHILPCIIQCSLFPSDNPQPPPTASVRKSIELTGLPIIQRDGLPLHFIEGVGWGGVGRGGVGVGGGM